MLMNATRAQAVKAIGLEHVLPGDELLLRQLIAAASFIEGSFTAADCGHDRGFATG